jgi:hypothetical protein
MRPILLPDERERSERDSSPRQDRLSLLLYRAFLIAHGRPRGPLSTVTAERGLHIATKVGAPLQ